MNTSRIRALFSLQILILFLAFLSASFLLFFSYLELCEFEMLYTILIHILTNEVKETLLFVTNYLAEYNN